MTPRHICALCSLEKPLCNSHIVPEFIYTVLYDDLHRFHELSIDEKKPHKYQQKGYREHLLCKDCENQLSNYEDYVKRILFGDIEIKSSRKGKLIFLSGIRYREFRLFALSVLWRASVCSHEFFGKVDLGPHEEKLREMIRTENPGKPHEYGFFLSPLVDENEELVTIMPQPVTSRIGDCRCYLFVFGGLVWAFTASSHQAPKIFRDAFLNEKGEMTLLLSKLDEVTFIQKFLADLRHRAHDIPA